MFVPSILLILLILSKPSQSAEELLQAATNWIIGGRLLKIKEWPSPGFLPETSTRATTASAEFKFEAPKQPDLKRAIVVVRGSFGEIDLTAA